MPLLAWLFVLIYRLLGGPGRPADLGDYNLSGWGSGPTDADPPGPRTGEAPHQDERGDSPTPGMDARSSGHPLAPVATTTWPRVYLDD